jgi:hypothetical protein
MGVWKYGSEAHFSYSTQLYFQLKELNINGSSLAHSHTCALQRECGQGWIRTTELRREQIYSLLSLAT